jgi:hypothetical protein
MSLCPCGVRWCAAQVPISLYVSVELVKLVQAYMMQQDLGMYCPFADAPAKVSNLCALPHTCSRLDRSRVISVYVHRALP